LAFPASRLLFWSFPPLLCNFGVKGVLPSEIGPILSPPGFPYPPNGAQRAPPEFPGVLSAGKGFPCSSLESGFLTFLHPKRFLCRTVPFLSKFVGEIPLSYLDICQSKKFFFSFLGRLFFLVLSMFRDNGLSSAG